MKLTVKALPVEAVVITVGFEIVPPAVMPLAYAVAGAVIPESIRAEAGFAV